MNSKLLPLLIILFCGSIIVLVTDKIISKKKSEASQEEEEQHVKEEEEGFDKPLEFIRFHNEIRTRDGQERPAYTAGYKMIELNKAKTLSRARVSSHGKGKGTVVAWTERGPGNVPGRTRALFNIPDATNNIWLAGAATGGIWKTTDGGSTWDEKNDNLTALPIASFAADKNATRIYAGTGEFVSTLFSAQGDGIFVSTNKGDTWTQLNTTKGNPDFAIVTRLIVNPDDANMLIASTAPSNLNPGDNTSAIMRSTNGGASWTKVKEIPGIIEQVIATPGNFNIQYASQNGVGVWKSVDAGATWNLSNTGMNPTGRIELAVSPVTPSRIFASAEGTLAGAESDLYVSTDAAVSWSLVNVKIGSSVVDFLGNKADESDSQGFYDNTILCDPFNENIVYMGGISLFRTTLGSASGTTIDNYRVEENNTQTFLTLQSFSGTAFDNERLTVGNSAEKRTVEIRFGTGQSQKAHRFLVPPNETNGVDASDFTYQDYVDVPFEVWDITGNRQLMVSFRDQNRNGVFDLVPQYITSNGIDYLQNSREYLYINNVPYTATPNADIASAGGQEFNLMYNIFPALAPGATWNSTTLPDAKLIIRYNGITTFNSTTITVTDAYGNFDGKNTSDQENLAQGVHPDHHFMIPVITSETGKIYKIVLGNDGGVFVSNASTTPGTTNGTWQFKGLGYNTSQFYGADKKPHADEYIGGLQDNGTRISPAGVSASAQSQYKYALGGDGFDVIWHSRDEKKILGSIYNGQIYRTTNGGTSWTEATTGLTTGTNFPFVTKLTNAKDFPDRVFTVSTEGVHVSTNFGSSWSLTAIPEKFAPTGPTLLDVEVSRANANIVWAGSGMSNTSGTERNLFVSTDGGTTFEATTNYTTVTMGAITRLASHPTEPKTAYALFSFAHAPKLLRTKDLGNTWEDISGFGTGSTSNNGFPDVAVYCLYVRPDDPDILWAGTEIGIVESQDNGETWSLLLDFPKVAVWDMKGQDNQVVIATHGRGIWTATLNAPQSDLVKTPTIIASGTNPKEQLALRIMSEELFDSLHIVIDGVKRASLKPILKGQIDVALNNITPGNKIISLITYRNNAPYQSEAYTVNNLDLLETVNTYATYFNNTSDFAIDGFTLQNFANSTNGERKDLQTNHTYTTSKTYTAILRKPVKVNDSLPILYYADVAIIEPANDYAMVEATKNGLDWTPLSGPYDANANTLWQNAYTTGKVGTRSMLIANKVDLSTKFLANDTLIFRWRMESGPTITAWGWAIDYIAIQEEPLGLEHPVVTPSLVVFPNPTYGMVTIHYQLQKPADVTARIVDMTGRTITTQNLGAKNTGKHDDVLNLQNQPGGTYLLLLETGENSKVIKIIKR